MMDLYKIYKKVNGRNIHIGNVRAQNHLRAKQLYSKQAGLEIQDYKRYNSKLIKLKIIQNEHRNNKTL